ncbi:MAG: cytochrome c [Xanthomonadales bacterium]|nr:cytochrome c [Xanthomonadales bacterium]
MTRIVGLLAVLVLGCTCAHAAGLVLELGGAPRTIDAAALLARPDVREVAIAADVAYGRAMRYRALPLRDLLVGIGAGDHLQFVALDGFAAEIPAAVLLDARGSAPWLAIEDPARPWPKLPGKEASAGPFYLVWIEPAAAGIGPEQWPYQIAAIRRLAPVAERFPALLPDPSLDAGSPVRRGFAVFQTTCLACHTLNGAGAARMGPDLNIPHSPTEYMQAAFLRRYIRDPQSLRHWPEARMPGFAASVLPDADLDALLDYLRHMAKRKAAVEPR